jgi:sugar phosphate isomerase/epimerase
VPRPITLFTGQWADLPLAELAPLAKEMGYDGLELACWGDHFELERPSPKRATSRTSAESSKRAASSVTRSAITSSAKPSAIP